MTDDITNDRSLTDYPDTLPEPGHKFIMSVLTYGKTVDADYKVANGQKVVAYGVGFNLTGKPAGGWPKELTMATLHFVDDPKDLQQPRVDVSDDPPTYDMHIYYPLSYLSAVEEMLKAPGAVQCVIANYSGPTSTYMHADVEFEPAT
jgi:hypothetical protein